MTVTEAQTLPAFLRHGIHVMTKPIGPICNLDCEYCYYLHKEDLYGKGERWRMQQETLLEYIRQYIQAQPANAEEVTFAWQGGEPTLLGLEFFQQSVAFQKQLARPGQKIVNTLQTNGVLLNESWCEFFKQEGFLIGLSIDGPKELHDHYRYDKQGHGTFDAVHAALKLLQRHDVEYNVLVVVNHHNGDHGRRVYSYLRDNGVQFLQFIPIVEKRGVGVHAEPPLAEIKDEQTLEKNNDWSPLVSSRSVEPEQWGRFLVAVFEEWVRRDVGKVFVQIFDQALSAWMDIEPSLCIFRKQCGKALAMEHNGDLYSCDHFVEPDYQLGNIHELPIVELASSIQQQEFGAAKQNTLPQYCRDCEVLFACNGECPKNRFISTPDGEAGLNYLCAGYRRFFNHIDSAMKLMRTELQQGRPAANVMFKLRAEKSASTKTTPQRKPGMPRRNDPCPCGSGRKFKKCCQP